MKTLKSIGLFYSSLFICLALLTTSCKKEAVSETNTSANDLLNLPMATTTSMSTTTTAAVTYCSEKIVPFCDNGVNYGNLSIKRGSDNKIYATVNSTIGWYLAQINLYTGSDNNIPSDLSDFNSKKTFTYPYTAQTQAFTISGMPTTFTVVGYAILIKKNSYGLITGYKVLWANGCSGTPVCSYGYYKAANSAGDVVNCGCGDLTDAVKFTYSASACVVDPAPAPVVQQEPDICSRASDCFFGINPLYNAEVPWSYPDVTVGGYTYTELEARAIGGLPLLNGLLMQDSKNGFMAVATLKLSGTEYQLSPTLAPAVNTIETWLATKGKLSALNLPTGNSPVKAAADLINSWINDHICPDRR